MTPPSPLLWLALSPHGYGHMAMTAPVVNALRQCRPDVRLTIQTNIPRSVLARRYGDAFEHVPEIPDFGFVMNSSTDIDIEASMDRYRRLHADWDGIVAMEAARLRKAAPCLVLANVPYTILAAAHEAGIPAIAMSSLNWADLFHHYLGGFPDAARIESQMRTAYDSAKIFLRCLPAMEMHLSHVRDIGPLAKRGRARSDELRTLLNIPSGRRLGLFAFGGIRHDLPLERVPRLEGWHWLAGGACPAREDMSSWDGLEMDFTDLVASADVVISKPGYGIFTEAGLSGTPVLFQERPDWPETIHLEAWLKQRAPCRAASESEIFSPYLQKLLMELDGDVRPPRNETSGIEEAVSVLISALNESASCERS